MRNIIRLEFSKVEIDLNDRDYTIHRLSDTYLLALINKANELGLEGKKIKVVEVKENFTTHNKYIDFIVDDK